MTPSKWCLQVPYCSHSLGVARIPGPSRVSLLPVPLVRRQLRQRLWHHLVPRWGRMCTVSMQFDTGLKPEAALETCDTGANSRDSE